MDSSPTYEINWQLIAASLQKELSDEEALQLAQWLSADKANQEKYDQLARLWNDGLADFPVYQMANETDGWLALQKQLKPDSNPIHKNETITKGKLRWLTGIRRLVAVAALFLSVIVTLFWYSTKDNSGQSYKAELGAQKKILLPDGTVILLKQLSEIQVADNYNKKSRSVTLIKGEAFFEVKHITELPFIVNVGPSAVKDIGTSFTINKTDDSIKVMVTSGTVVFIDKKTQEFKELSSGMASSLAIHTLHFSKTTSITLPIADSSKLNFYNIALGDIITVIGKTYNRKIVLANEDMARKKFTGNLNGETFDRAMEVICSSLNLVNTEKNGIYILSEK